MFNWRTSIAALRRVSRISMTVLALGIGGSYLAFTTLASFESRLVQDDFQRAADGFSVAIQLAIDRGFAVANSTGALFDSSPDVSLSQFVLFSTQLMKENQEIEAITWVPRVPAASLAVFEKTAGKEFPGFQVWEFDSRSQRIKATNRSDFFPVAYAHGKTDISLVAGYDVNSSAIRKIAVERARDTGQPSATAKVVGIGKRVAAPAFLVFRPVYQGGAMPETVEQRRQSLRGFTMSVFYINDLIGDVLSRLGPQHIQAVIYDVSSAGSKDMLGSWPKNEASRATANEPPDLAEPFHHEASFEVGGRTWLLAMTPAAGKFGTATSWRAWSALAAGLLLTALLLAYLESARRQSRNAEHQAITDSLTGLHNRWYLKKLLPREFHRAIRHGTPITCMLLDIDFFKRINDTFGHDAGDLVIRQVAALLKASVRGSDIVCRYGGEEFVLILPDISAGNASLKAEEIRLAVQNLNLIHRGQSLGNTSVSIGISSFPESAADADSLLRAADISMYWAKRDGRNRVAIYPAKPAPPKTFVPRSDSPLPESIS